MKHWAALISVYVFVFLILVISVVLMSMDYEPRNNVVVNEGGSYIQGDSTGNVYGGTITGTGETVQPAVMSQEELNEAFDRTEYQMVTAALQAESSRVRMNGNRGAYSNHLVDHTIYYGNLDHDPDMELLYGSNFTRFDLSDGKKCYGQGTTTTRSFYLDKNGMFYDMIPLGEEYYYSAADGTTFSYWPNYDYTDMEARLNKKEIPYDELQAYMEELNLQPITDQSVPSTAYSYDEKYAHSLLDGLDQYFRAEFSRYQGKYCADLDADGTDETLFLIPGFMDPWFEDYDLNSITDEFFSTHNIPGLDMNLDRTAIVIADNNGSELRVQAYCVEKDITLSSVANISYGDNCILLDGVYVYANFQPYEKSKAFYGLNQYLTAQGYTNILMKAADLSEAVNDEILVIGEKEDKWMILIYTIRADTPVLVYYKSLEGQSCFLTEYAGMQALIHYNQNVSLNYNNQYHHNYNYKVFRMDGAGNFVILDEKQMSYSEDEESAEKAAEFFEALNDYLIKLIVIYDPYALSGENLLTTENADFGTSPDIGSQEQPNPDKPDQEEPNQQPDQEKPKQEEIGFVSIQDPNSWLHLRVGPGLEYDKVLMDSQDSNSFVRQALGAPVTILETVEVENDEENPVWVKIRIRYEGMEIVGYSSKTFIRLASES